MSVKMVVGLFCWPVRREPEEAEAEAIGLAFLNRCAAFEGSPFVKKGCGWPPKEPTLTAHLTLEIPESPFHHGARTVLSWCTKLVTGFWGLAPWTFAFSRRHSVEEKLRILGENAQIQRQ